MNDLVDAQEIFFQLIDNIKNDKKDEAIKTVTELTEKELSRYECEYCGELCDKYRIPVDQVIHAVSLYV